MIVTKPGTVEVSEDNVVIKNFDLETEEGELGACSYKAALAACEWAKAEMDKTLKELYKSEKIVEKEIHLKSLEDLEIVNGCYQLDPLMTYIVANPIICDIKPIEDKTPYYRKFERKRGR